MTTIALRFPSHRYHATPWGHHVNEGIAEWPPSPYRLLRSLYDVWKRKHPELSEAQVEAVLAALASELPHFRVPQVTPSHTRAYLSSNSLDPNAKSLIFDAFMIMGPKCTCYLTWQSVQLSAEQASVLNTLLTSLNYLGRSESWVSASLLEEEGEGQIAYFPAEAAQGTDTVLVSCSVPMDRYEGKQRWLEALASSTGDFLKARRSSPPAMRSEMYQGTRDAVLPHVRRRVEQKGAQVQAVLLALDSTVLPLATATLDVSEQIRVRLMGICKKMTGNPEAIPAVFKGKDENAAPLTGHQHLFILPLTNDRSRIDRVLLYVKRGGFDELALQAILRLRSLRYAGEHPVHCVVTWKGRADDAPVARRACMVTSTTPFVTPRHWRRGRGDKSEFLREQVRRECMFHGLPAPLKVEEVEHAPGFFDWIEFRRNRRKDPPRGGSGFRIEFPEEVVTPFSIGYGCHFGLGQFGSGEE